MAWEGRSNHNGHVDGPCLPCPETAGSDCSRCSNPGWPGKGNRSAFEPLVPGVMEAPAAGVFDVLKIPSHLPAGDYVLGWRYDCEGTAQVRAAAASSCAQPVRARAHGFRWPSDAGETYSCTASSSCDPVARAGVVQLRRRDPRRS